MEQNMGLSDTHIYYLFFFYILSLILCDGLILIKPRSNPKSNLNKKHQVLTKYL